MSGLIDHFYACYKDLKKFNTYVICSVGLYHV